MSEQTIQSQDISVADLFKSFYVVPDYQREYVWEEENVEQLLADIHAEMGVGSSKESPEYFIGSIVVCPADNGLLELIDGQKRMTTLFLTLCAIRDHIQKIGKPAIKTLQEQLRSTSADVTGQEVERFRLDLQYADSGDVLVRIARAEDPSKLSLRTRSVENIIRAHSVAQQFLHRSFGEDDSASRRFYGYLTNKVKLIRIQAQDVAKALKIFETINDRGVGLDAMDLLKNLLFMKASRAQFDSLKDTWKSLQDTLFAIREKPLRFLRYFIFSQYSVDMLREDEIYAWFSKNEAIAGYSRDPLGFAKSLLEAAHAYRNFFNGLDKNGNKNRYLENMKLLGGKAARQHLILLLAGRNLAPPLFDSLCREVENLFFCYVITREATRDFERNFAIWAQEIRAAKSAADLASVFQSRFEKAKVGLAARFGDTFERLDTEALQAYRLKYLLAKLAQSIELNAYGDTEGTRSLSRFVEGSYEIEHIFPQNPSEQAIVEFGPYSDTAIAGRLGNLVLVEKSINASLGNRPFSEKRRVYPQSQLLLTRALAEKPKIGANTRIDAAVSDLEPYSLWNEGAIGERQKQLTELACAVWGVRLPVS